MQNKERERKRKEKETPEWLTTGQRIKRKHRKQNPAVVSKRLKTKKNEKH